jgi:hypothetical protein
MGWDAAGMNGRYLAEHEPDFFIELDGVEAGDLLTVEVIVRKYRARSLIRSRRGPIWCLSNEPLDRHCLGVNTVSFLSTRYRGFRFDG